MLVREDHSDLREMSGSNGQSSSSDSSGSMGSYGCRPDLRASYRRAFHDIYGKPPSEIPKPSCKVLVNNGITRKSRFEDAFKLKVEDLVVGRPVTLAFVYRAPELPLPSSKAPRQLTWKNISAPITRVAPHKPYRFDAISLF